MNVSKWHLKQFGGEEKLIDNKHTSKSLRTVLGFDDSQTKKNKRNVLNRDDNQQVNNHKPIRKRKPFQRNPKRDQAGGHSSENSQ